MVLLMTLDLCYPHEMMDVGILELKISQSPYPSIFSSDNFQYSNAQIGAKC